MSVLQVAPSSGQNWLSSSHGGATERCQFLKWRHLPDKTGYHHHHMVAPLSGARYSSGAIFRTKTGLSSSSHGGATERCQFFKWRHLPDQNWSSSSSSHGGATERCQVFKWRHLPDKTGYHHHHMVAPRAVPGIQVRHLPDKTGHHHHHHMVAPLSGARYSSGAIFRTKLVIIITWWRH